MASTLSIIRDVLSRGLIVVTTVVTAGTARAVGTGTAGTVATRTRAVGTRTTVATVAITTGTGTTGATTLATLVITLGLVLEGAHRQAELTGLLINLDELDSNLVALSHGRA